MEVVNKIKVIENTNYGLLLSLLLLNNISEIEYIFPSYFDMKIVNKMFEKNIKIKISKYGTLKHNFFNHYFRTFKNILSFKNSNIKIYGNDHIDISIPYRKCDFYLIEDGQLNYTYHKLDSFDIIKRLIYLENKNIMDYYRLLEILYYHFKYKFLKLK